MGRDAATFAASTFSKNERASRDVLALTSPVPHTSRRKNMFLVMGITGRVGGATAEHLLAHGEEVRALVRNREKAANWADQGVELVDGDWNDSAAIEQALEGVEGAFVMLPAVWAPSP